MQWPTQAFFALKQDCHDFEGSLAVWLSRAISKNKSKQQQRQQKPNNNNLDASLAFAGQTTQEAKVEGLTESRSSELAGQGRGTLP